MPGCTASRRLASIVGAAPNRQTRSPPERMRASVSQAVAVLAMWAAAGYAQQPAPPPAPAPTRQHLDCTAYTGLSYVYDSNIDHTQPALDTFGGLGGLGGECRLGSSSSGILDLSYDGVFRQYARTSIWNIPGHDLRADLRGLFVHHVMVGSTLEAVLNGSAEDHVLRNEY